LKKYELMWIVGGNIDENVAKESLTRITKSISIAKECKVVSSSIWARRN
jgi:hypothetical protein